MYDLHDLNNLPLDNWKERVKNDFEETIFKKYPEIERIKNELYAQGAVYASMTGSGSGVFGIFPRGSEVKAEPMRAESLFIDHPDRLGSRIYRYYSVVAAESG